MKRTQKHFSHYIPAYPNEADANYYKEKLVVIVTGILSGFCLMGSVVLFTMLT